MATLSSDLQTYLSNSNSNNNNNNKSNGFSFDGFRTSSQRMADRWFGGYDRLQVNTDQPTIVPDNSKDSNWFSKIDGQDHVLPSLSKTQRIIGFFICVLMGALFMGLACLYLPFLILKARKFALLYTLGSLFLLSSFSLLWGPMNHVKHLCSIGRLPFTMAYFGTMFATLYFSMVIRSTPLTVIFAALQIFALVWYITSYIPGGQMGFKFLSRIFSSAVTRTVSKTIPV